MQAHVRHLAFLGGLALLGVQTACQMLQQQQPDIKTEENAIRQADMDWSKAAASKDVDKVVSYYVEDGAVYTPNAPIAAGRPAIKVAWTGMVNLPGFMVNWVPSRVEVARSADLGWSTGTYTLTTSVPGSSATDHGKYVAVWKKQPDGSWKVQADIFNSDLPAAGISTSAQRSQTLTPPPPAQ
jgi:ketosteroid isomerase-like protein